jgi:hypothetical protein
MARDYIQCIYLVKNSISIDIIYDLGLFPNKRVNVSMFPPLYLHQVAYPHLIFDDSSPLLGRSHPGLWRESDELQGVLAFARCELENWGSIGLE